MANPLQIVEVATRHAGHLNALCSLLMDVVDDGASVGFLPPLRYADALFYWEHLFEPGVRLWVALYDGEVAGTIQLHFSMKQNGAHRAEIAKLMVHPQRRQLGIARQLMEVAEWATVQAKRSLLTLDTRAGDPSNALYRSLSFMEAGRIPQYAQSADGQLHETVIYYKWLGESREIDLSAQRSTSPGVLHHVEINVSNLHRSAEFWGWLLGYLGYEPYQHWPAGCSWRKGETYIVLVQTEPELSVLALFVGVFPSDTVTWNACFILITLAAKAKGTIRLRIVPMPLYLSIRAS